MIGKVMLFNPFTGTPRHPDDIKSDPAGMLVWDGEEPLRASAPQASQPPQGAADFDTWYARQCASPVVVRNIREGMQLAWAAALAASPPPATMTEAQALAIADKYGQRWKAPDEEGISFEKSHFFMFLADLLTEPLYAAPAPVSPEKKPPAGGSDAIESGAQPPR
jgi:hypothetical protein